MSTPVVTIETVADQPSVAVPTLSEGSTPVVPGGRSRAARVLSRTSRVVIELGKWILVLAILVLFLDHFSRGMLSGLVDSGFLMPIPTLLSTSPAVPR